MAIRDLAVITAITGAEMVPMASAAIGTDVQASISLLKSFFSPIGDQVENTQYAAPAASGFLISVKPVNDFGSVWLLLTPSAAFAAGTIKFPDVDDCVDGQQISLTCTQAVTAIAFTSTGSNVIGAPASLAANSFAGFRFDGVFKQWYRFK